MGLLEADVYVGRCVDTDWGRSDGRPPPLKSVPSHHKGIEEGGIRERKRKKERRESKRE